MPRTRLVGRGSEMDASAICTTLRRDGHKKPASPMPETARQGMRMERVLLAVVPEPAGIPTICAEHRSQEGTRTYDDHVADGGRKQARNRDEAKPGQPAKDPPPRAG